MTKTISYLRDRFREPGTLKSLIWLLVGVAGWQVSESDVVALTSLGVAVLGGVNAATQQDGYPGFGGVFVESLMGFSLDPGRWAMQVPGADPEFDKIFDPFRSDRDGRAISSSGERTSTKARVGTKEATSGQAGIGSANT